MLMMSRRVRETILIGDDIEIVITHIGRTRVKVGIKAPRGMTVMAREAKLVRDENVTAASAASDPAWPDLAARLRSDSHFPSPRR